MTTPVFADSQFSRRPNPEQMPQRFELKRIPPGGASGLICLSDDVVGSDVHYVGGRTVCCPGESCPANHDKCRIEWRGYLFVWNPRKQEVICIEVTPAAMAPIDQAYRDYDGLRGVKMEFTRRGEQKNGQLSSKCFAPARDKTGLPKAPSLRKFLCKVWQVEYFDDRQKVTDEMLKSRNGRASVLKLDRGA